MLAFKSKCVSSTHGPQTESNQCEIKETNFTRNDRFCVLWFCLASAQFVVCALFFFSRCGMYVFGSCFSLCFYFDKFHFNSSFFSDGKMVCISLSLRFSLPFPLYLSVSLSLSFAISFTRTRNSFTQYLWYGSGLFLLVCLYFVSNLFSLFSRMSLFDSHEMIHETASIIRAISFFFSISVSVSVSVFVFPSVHLLFFRFDWQCGSFLSSLALIFLFSSLEIYWRKKQSKTTTSAPNFAWNTYEIRQHMNHKK